MSATIVRQTVLPDEVQEEIQAWRRFQARLVHETLTVNDQGKATYRIKVSGPTFTPKGNLHASNRADVQYGDGWRHWNSIPEWLTPHLLGPETLLEALKQQVAKAEWTPREEES